MAQYHQVPNIALMSFTELTQYTASLPHNAQLSELEQVNYYFISIHNWPRTKACNLNTKYTYFQLQIKGQTRGKTVTGAAQI